MSPQHALQNPIFLAYLRIIFVSLVVGGIVLGILHFGFKKNLGSIWSTYRSWLIMAPVGLAAVFAGRIPTIVGVRDKMRASVRSGRISEHTSEDAVDEAFGELVERLLLSLFQEEITEQQVIHVRPHETGEGIDWRAHDRFPADVERRIDDHRATGFFLEPFDHPVIHRLMVLGHGLDSR